jgi:hypothetical protein
MAAQGAQLSIQHMSQRVAVGCDYLKLRAGALPMDLNKPDKTANKGGEEQAAEIDTVNASTSSGGFKNPYQSFH